MGLNPGGGRGEDVWSDDAALSLEDQCNNVNAYFDQPWGNDGGFTPLQRQIQLLRDGHFPQVELKRLLSFQLIPFRSPSWSEFPAQSRQAAVEFGLKLMPWTLAHLRSDVPVIAFGLREMAPALVDWFEASNERRIPTGWGKIRATIYDTPKAQRLIFLPHLSRYRIFGRPQFVECDSLFSG